MPTYQYACTACGEKLEAVQSFTDARLTQCPACGGHLRKVFSAVGVVFKGSGFYKNDSRKSEKKDAPKKDAVPAAATSTSSSDSSPTSATSPSSTPAAATSTSSPSTPAAKSA